MTGQQRSNPEGTTNLRELHNQHVQALSSGNRVAKGELLTYQSVFYGFFDDIKLNFPSERGLLVVHNATRKIASNGDFHEPPKSVYLHADPACSIRAPWV